MALPLFFSKVWKCYDGAVQRWNMSGVQIVNELPLVGVKFNLVPTEGLMQVPKIGLSFEM